MLEELGWKKPISHNLHALVPISSWKNPASQDDHLLAPGDFAYFPKVQLVQFPPSVLENQPT